MLEDTQSSTSSFELINDDPTFLDNELDLEFPVIDEDTEDDFSLLSFCEDLLDSIELLPTVRCYKHSRNPKLNRQLSFAVFFSVAIVTGLGIGNFLGHSSNRCERLGHIVSDNVYELYMTKKYLATTPDHDRLSNEVNFSKEVNVILERKEELPSVFIKCALLERVQEEMDNSSVTEDVVKSVILNDVVNLTGKYNQLPSNVEHVDVLDLDLDRNSVEGRGKTPSVDMVEDIEWNGGLEQLIDQSFRESVLKVPHDIHYSDVLNLLGNGVKDIVTKMQDLIVVMAEGGNGDSMKYSGLRKVESMFKKYLLSVQDKTDELSKLVSLSSFDSSSRSKKQFAKLSQVIVKSVDRLMQDSIAKALVKGRKSLDVRLGNVADIGFGIIRELDSRWVGQREKFNLSIEKDRRKPPNTMRSKGHKAYNKKYDKFDNRPNKSNKMKESHEKKRGPSEKRYFQQRE